MSTSITSSVVHITFTLKVWTVDSPSGLSRANIFKRDGLLLRKEIKFELRAHLGILFTQMSPSSPFGGGSLALCGGTSADGTTLRTLAGPACRANFDRQDPGAGEPQTN